MALVIFVLRLAIGVLLIVAGTLKAHDGPAATAVTIAGYRILPGAVVAPLGIALPYFEIFLGFYLAAGLFTRISAWIATVQFALFAVAVASLVIRQIPADCGCFGSALPTPPSWGHVAADVALALVTVLIALRGPGILSVDRAAISEQLLRVWERIANVMSRPGRQIINTKKSAPIAQRRNLFAIGSLVILALVIIVAVSLANRVPQSATTAANSLTAVKVGDVAPDFSVSTTSGPFELKAAANKPTLLEVFATWCPHCQREVTVLDPLYGAYKGKVNFVAVNGAPLGMDQQPETQADVIAFAQKFNVTYPIAFDPNLDVAHKYLQSGFPTVVLIGTDGKVVSIRDGEIPPADLKNALNAAIAGKSPDPKMGFKG